MKKIFLSSLILGLLLVVYVGCGQNNETGRTLEAAKAMEVSTDASGQDADESSTPSDWGDAPDFTLKDLDGNDFTLSSFKGKVLIVDFWATWCPPCRMEIPSFVELYSTYRDKGLEIVGVTLDKEGVKVIKPFAEEYNINYKLVLGTQEVAQAYGGIRGIPTTFVIDRSGNIVKKTHRLRSKRSLRIRNKRVVINLK